MNHQFNLFSHKEVLQKTKVPISAEKIRLAKEQIAKRDSKGAIQTLRDINDALENYERRIHSRKKD